MEKFGTVLRELRISKNLTQKQLAQILKTSRQNLSRWELGQFEPDLNMLTKMADYFGISIDELLLGEYTYFNVEHKKTNLQEYVLKLYNNLSAENKKIALSYLLNLATDESGNLSDKT